ncbi:MAG: DoxX family membrane protein [Pseudomonadota bacterium]
MTDLTATPPKSNPIIAARETHNTVAAACHAASDTVLTTLARFAFAAVLLQFFWNSAGTKLDGLFTPSLGAYAQIFPKAMEAVGYDVSQLSVWHTAVVLMGSWAEYVLPALVVVGLFTRLAAVGMIGFIAVMTFVDITGHGLDAATIGAWFNAGAYDLIFDQRTLWVVVLLMLVFKGAGPLSADRLFGLK